MRKLQVIISIAVGLFFTDYLQAMMLRTISGSDYSKQKVWGSAGRKTADLLFNETSIENGKVLGANVPRQAFLEQQNRAEKASNNSIGSGSSMGPSEKKADATIPPIRSQLDLFKINAEYSTKYGDYFNPETMPEGTSVQDYITALKGKGFSNLPESLLTPLAIDFIEKQSGSKSISFAEQGLRTFFNAPVVNIITKGRIDPTGIKGPDQIINRKLSWNDPNSQNSIAVFENAYTGLRYVNDTYYNADGTLKIAIQLPEVSMGEPFQNYINALHKNGYPDVPDEILAICVTEFLNNRFYTKAAWDSNDRKKISVPDLNKPLLTSPADLITALQGIKLIINQDGVLVNEDGKPLTPFQKLYLTAKAIRDITAKYPAEYKSPITTDLSHVRPTSIDMSRLSTTENSVTSKPGEGFQLRGLNEAVPVVPIVQSVEKSLGLNQSSPSQAPIKLSLDVATVPKANAIQAMAIESHGMGDIKNFENAIGIPDAFTATGPTIPVGVDQSTRNSVVPDQVAKIINYYRQKNTANLFDPWVALTKDINALRAETSWFSTNFPSAISLADQAAKKMFGVIGSDGTLQPGILVTNEAQGLITASLPSTGSSIYSAVKQSQECINSAQTTIVSLHGQDATTLAIGKQYVDLYIAVHSELLKVQNAVTTAEGNRLKLGDIEEAHKNIEKQLAKLPIIENQVIGTLTNRQVLEQALAQIDLDLVEQKKADQARAQLEDEAFDVLSKNITAIPHVDVIKNALDDLITKLNADKNADKSFIEAIKKARIALNDSNLRNKNESDRDGIVTKLEKLVTDVNNTTPDFADFLKKTDTLQVYIAVIYKLLETMEESDKQGIAEQFITNVSQEYAKQLFEESHNLEDSIVTINEKIIACNASTGFDLNAALKEIRDKTVSAPTTLIDLKEFYQKVLNDLEIKQTNNKNLAGMEAEALSRATILLNDAKNNPKDPTKDPIIIALKDLSTKISPTDIIMIKSRQILLTKYIEDLLGDYEKSDKKIDAVTTVDNAIHRLYDLKITKLDKENKEYPTEDPIISGWFMITNLFKIFKENDDIQKKVDNIVRGLVAEKYITVGSRWLNVDIINRAKIEKSFIKSQTLTQNELPTAITEFNQGLSGYTIPTDTPLEVYKGVLLALKTVEEGATKNTLVYQNLDTLRTYTIKPVVDVASYVGDKIMPKREIAPLSPADQAAIQAAHQNIIDTVKKPGGATDEEVHDACLNLARVMCSTSNMVAAAFSVLGTGTILTLLINLVQYLQQNQKSNSSQEEKDNNAHDALQAFSSDLIDELIVYGTGAGLDSVQSRDKQAIALDALLNKFVNSLDPSEKTPYKYGPTSIKNSKTNLDKLKTKQKNSADLAVMAIDAKNYAKTLLDDYEDGHQDPLKDPIFVALAELRVQVGQADRITVGGKSILQSVYVKNLLSDYEASDKKANALTAIDNGVKKLSDIEKADLDKNNKEYDSDTIIFSSLLISQLVAKRIEDIANSKVDSHDDSSSYAPSSPYAPKNYKQPVTLPVTSKKTYPSYQDLLDMEKDGSSYDPNASNAGG